MNLYTLSFKLRGYNINKAFEHLQEVQKLSSTDFNAWQIAQRNLIVEYHKEHSTLYQNLLVSDKCLFEELPIIQKKDFQGKLNDIISNEYKLNDLYIGATSGSSGHPFYFAKNKEAHSMTHALIKDRYAWFDLNVDDKQARFFGIPLKGKSRYKELLKDKLSNRVRFPVFDLSDETLSIFYNQFKKIRFTYIYGYTSSLLLFAKFILNQGIQLKKVCHSLRYTIVTSEVCTKEDKKMLGMAFGVPVLNEYGASEIDVLAFTNGNSDWQLSEENVYFEVVDESNQLLPDGEEGKIIVTSLYNKAMPVIRYEIGDMGIIERTGNKRILKKLSGRVNDIAVLPSGKKSPGLTFYYIAKSVLEKTDNIKEFIIKQTDINVFEFDVVSSLNLTNNETQLLKEKMDIYLEPNLKLKINQVEKIERPVSGKIKHFYSLISQ